MVATRTQRKRQESIVVCDGLARLILPTAKRKTWQVFFFDPVSGKRRSVSGGHSREEAEHRAREVLGMFVPEHLRKDAVCPTFQDCWERWLDENRSRLNLRSVDNYSALAKRLLVVIGDVPIRRLTPEKIREIDVSALSVEQQKKTRTILRHGLSVNSEWLSSYSVEQLTRALRISAHKNSEGGNAQVARGSIPPQHWLGAVIQASLMSFDDPYFHTPLGEMDFLPLEESFLNERVAKIPPQVKKNRAELEQASRARSIAMLRQWGLMVILASNTGMRIGELLGLRVKNLLDEDTLYNDMWRWEEAEMELTTYLETSDSVLEFSPEDTPCFIHYNGRILVEEQASQTSKGKTVVGFPKYESSRTVWLSPVMFGCPWNEASGRKYRTASDKAIDFVNASPSPLNVKKPADLWMIGRADAHLLWASGVIPVAYILRKHLSMLWNSPALTDSADCATRTKRFRELLVFPAISPARTGRDGLPNVIYESRRFMTPLPSGSGGYQSATNLATRWTNPIFDFFSEIMDDYPVHRLGLQTRRGYSFHALRHYAISQMLEKGIPLAVVSKLAGHKHIDFTLRRYAHAFDEVSLDDTGLVL